MSTKTIIKTSGTKIEVVLDGVAREYVIGSAYTKKFERFTDSAGNMIIPAFNKDSIFEGICRLSPAPKTLDDIKALGIDVFKSALASAVITLQAQIRSSGTGKRAIDNALAELTKRFALGELTAEQLKAEIDKLMGNSVAQLSTTPVSDTDNVAPESDIVDNTGN